MRSWLERFREAGAVASIGAAQHTLRVLLGVFLLIAGISHLTWEREEFRAQVPSWLPLDVDLVVIVSGVVEIALGAALLLLARERVLVGLVVAVFFVAIFPGNIAQFVERRDAFGLDTDLARGIRLLFQPVLVLWALWSTGASAALIEVWSGRRFRST